MLRRAGRGRKEGAWIGIGTLTPEPKCASLGSARIDAAVFLGLRRW
jgi:hypothetical protein